MVWILLVCLRTHLGECNAAAGYQFKTLAECEAKRATVKVLPLTDADGWYVCKSKEVRKA